jgi:hypothetical protein
MQTKKPNDLSKFSKRMMDRIENSAKTERLNIEGICNDRKLEPVPSFRIAPCEQFVANGQNNAQIVVGRDRPSELCSGYGGRGDTGAGAIDIVVGRKIPDEGIEDEEGNINYVDNDFTRDAARIYISQKTDIDKNFNIVKGGVGNSIERSGVAIKADSVRIIGNEGIKLVTRVSKSNSLGGSVTAVKGIDLMAGNFKHGLQPLVKGKNLIELLKLMQEDISKLAGMINSLAIKQVAMDTALATHMHNVIPDPTSPTLFGTMPSLTLAVQCAIDSVAVGVLDMPSHATQIMNSLTSESEYLTPGAGKYIASKYNKTN